MKKLFRVMFLIQKNKEYNYYLLLLCINVLFGIQVFAEGTNNGGTPNSTTCTTCGNCCGGYQGNRMAEPSPDAAPTIAISENTTICVGDSAILNAYSPVASAYSWSPASGLNVNTGASVIASPATTTTYTATVTNTAGCTATTTVTVFVNQPSTVTSSANPTTVCSGAFSQLSAIAIVTLSYCTIGNVTSGGCAFDEWISNVTFNTINNSSPCTLPSGYTDYTGISTNLTPGVYPLSVSIGQSFSGDQCNAFVDFNQDGDFIDVGEEFILTGGPPLFTGNIVVPAGAYNGDTRLRIRLTFTGSIVPCGTTPFGEVEDYTVNISGATVNPNPGVTYSWSPAAGLKPSSTVQNPETPALPNGTTVYTVTVSNNGCTATATTSVTSGETLVCSAVTTSSPFCSGGFTATANHTGGGAPFNYAWSDEVGGVYPNAQTVTVTLAAGAYTLECTVTDNCGGSCTSSIPVAVVSCGVTFTTNILIQGFYSGGGLMQNGGTGCLNVSGVSNDPLDVDTVYLSAMNATSPYSEVEIQKGILKTNGDITVTFSNAVVSGTPYYIGVTHRNSIETWSKFPVMFNSVTNYPFSSDQSQAFADNMDETFDSMGWAIYSGDINKDLAVDASDFLELDPSIQNGDGGYMPGDLNGDGSVDGSDFLVLYPNIQNGIGAAFP